MAKRVLVKCSGCGLEWEKARTGLYGWSGLCKSCAAKSRDVAVSVVEVSCQECGTKKALPGNAVPLWGGLCRRCRDNQKTEPATCSDCGASWLMSKNCKRLWQGRCTSCSSKANFLKPGFAERHRDQARRKMDPAKKAQRAIERFCAKVLIADECWGWSAGKTRDGYGTFSLNGRLKYAHVFSCELLIGPIPDGLELDHLCRNPSCSNPAHLEPVTHRENLLRGVGMTAKNAAKTHCAKGHAYSPENTLFRNGHHRVCRTCKQARDAERRARSRALCIG